MKSPINIHSVNQKIYLSVGIYSVKVLGGWGVKVNDFSVSLRKIENGVVIKSEDTFWKYQSHAFKNRAKKIAVLDVYESGNFLVEFKNSKKLKVRRSNLILTRFFEKELPNQDLEICIGC
ncbi:hypothetical protein [Aquimarina sp. MMG016]|uniref:hypothetical protein n=1 Tax=Aquimarina sp. MMG016 TaxID=2822690 RepID=UPI001B3A0AC9|nr:hypothetical protein [Aquimarina sp. MMG016]MBQ4818900.1 hypothetical protein [Aquimarina sp. MMG016]